MSPGSAQFGPKIGTLSEVDAENISVARLEAFLRQLSHDVRNDLNAMELLISYVEYEGSGGDAVNALKQLHDAVRYGAKRMLRVSKAVQEPDLNTILYPADVLHEDLRERLMLQHPELANRISWDGCAVTAVMLVDATLVLEAFTELLDNAAAFSSSAMPVRMSVDAFRGKVRWRIIQHAEESPLNIGQWGRIPLVSTRRSHYGLGLFRVRRILRAHSAVLAFEYDEADQVLVSEVVFGSNE
jgi:K+-sensing histidine kinase KdpD